MVGVGNSRNDGRNINNEMKTIENFKWFYKYSKMYTGKSFWWLLFNGVIFRAVLFCIKVKIDEFKNRKNGIKRV